MKKMTGWLGKKVWDFQKDFGYKKSKQWHEKMIQPCHQEEAYVPENTS